MGLPHVAALERAAEKKPDDVNVYRELGYAAAAAAGRATTTSQSPLAGEPKPGLAR
mgnify:CR=1 FL=1